MFPREVVKHSVSLAPALPTAESTTTRHADGSIRTSFQHRFTSDTPQANMPIDAPLKNSFPIPTTERSKHPRSLAFLADLASYWGQSVFIYDVFNTLMIMVISYLPPNSREDALRHVNEFAGTIAIQTDETQGAVDKLKTILGMLWNTPKPADKKGESANYINFRTSFWVKEVSSPPSAAPNATLSTPPTMETRKPTTIEQVSELENSSYFSLTCRRSTQSLLARRSLGLVWTC